MSTFHELSQRSSVDILRHFIIYFPKLTSCHVLVIIIRDESDIRVGNMTVSDMAIIIHSLKYVVSFSNADALLLTPGLLIRAFSGPYKLFLYFRLFLIKVREHPYANC